MGFMTWSSEFEFGIDAMDSQHKKWLEILNRFYDHIGEGNLKEKMLELVDEAIDYTAYHFREEERFLASIHYPDLADQKSRHQVITDRLQAFRTKIVEGHLLISTSLTSELKAWFRDHILVEDKKYANFLAKKSSLQASAV